MSETKTDAVVKRSTVEHFNPDDTGALYMQTSLFEQVQRAAMMLSRSNLVPAHLRGEDKVADCFLVIEQAMRWRMSPFAVAQSTYVLSGKLGYEGKLIAAVVNASPRLSKSLNFEYSGKGQDRQVRVYATLKGEDAPREVTGTVGAWKTNNKQWDTQIDQMLSYRGAREWARRHMPEGILGVYAEEELEQIATRPSVTTVSPQSLDDFLAPESMTTKDDPKREAKVVEAQVVTSNQQKLPGPQPHSPEELAEMFNKKESGQIRPNSAIGKPSEKDAAIEEMFK
jgi:hypothetical protein